MLLFLGCGHLACQNNGTTHCLDNRPYCRCSAGYYGTYCEHGKHECVLIVKVL